LSAFGEQSGHALPTRADGLRLAHDRRSNRFSIPILGVAPAGHEAVATWNEQELARERVRLWYVAATRARDLLFLPRHSAKLPDSSWARVVDLDLSSLAAMDPDALGDVGIDSTATAENMQTRTLFAEGAGRIAKAERSIEWQRPSRGELEASPPSEPALVFVDPEKADEALEVRIPDVAGGSMRGTVLHKLMEEVLTGETTDGVPSLTRRAAELLSQLGVLPAADAKSGIVPAELAETVAKTLRLPEVAALRQRLVPEHTIRSGNDLLVPNPGHMLHAADLLLHRGHLGALALVRAQSPAQAMLRRRFPMLQARRNHRARNKLGEAFISDLYADWAQHGAVVIAAVREQKPDAYLKVVASIIPHQLEIKDGPFDDMSDDQLASLIAFAQNTLGMVDQSTSGASETPH
jgi:hypothetical protein